MVDGAAQMPEIDWLDEIVKRAALHAKSCTGRVIYCSQHQEGDGRLQLHDPRDQLDTGNPGHVHIEEHSSDFLALKDRQCLLTTGGNCYFIALLSQKLAQSVPDRLLVVHDEQGSRLIR